MATSFDNRLRRVEEAAGIRPEAEFLIVLQEAHETESAAITRALGDRIIGPRTHVLVIRLFSDLEAAEYRRIHGMQ